MSSVFGDPAIDFPVDDTVGAWVPHGRFVSMGRASGPLAGLSFAVKDLFDVAGHATGAGNPAWLATHAVPTASSPLVEQLLDAGATLLGKVVTDELAYSIHGDNLHYGTPRNARAPGRVPGGSSSGSAAAVAAQLVDFALGTDTGGSTRVPASYCGLWGLRTTHGLLSRDGLVPLQPSYDTATWLAHDARVFERVGQVLLPSGGEPLSRVLAWPDAWREAEADFQPALQRAWQALGDMGLSQEVPAHIAQDGPFGADGNGLEAWRRTYVTASAYDGWQVHGEWIGSADRGFAPPVAARWKAAGEITADEARRARAHAASVQARVRATLGGNGVALVPSAASVAPLLDALPADVDAVRTRTMRITCIAGLAGLPQVSLPWRTDTTPARTGSLPIGLSLIGPPGSDLALIRLAVRLHAAMAAQESVAA